MFDSRCPALADRSCRFFRQKKEEKEGKKTGRNASGPSFFFLFFLPHNPLALTYSYARTG